MGERAQVISSTRLASDTEVPQLQIQLSIVTTLYKSSEFIDEFLDRCIAVAARNFSRFEILAVDDGSPDDSLAKTVSRAAFDNRIVPLKLSRNFGHHAALLAGLERAQGELVFLVDSDLEEKPEYLEDFLQRMRETNCDVVYGRHPQTEGSQLRRVTSRNFWKLFSAVSDVKVEENICHIRLMNREYVDALTGLAERNVFLGGLYTWPGFEQVSVMIDRKIRRKVSTYSLPARISLFARSVVAFSDKPLYLIFYLGVAVSTMSAIAVGFMTLRKLFYPDSVLQGFALLFVSIWLIGGVLILSLGVVGIYIAQIFKEVKARPRYIIRNATEQAQASKRLVDQ